MRSRGRCSGNGFPASRPAKHQGIPQGTAEQDGSQRCARHLANQRVNLFRPVHVKTLASQKRRALLTARKLQGKAIAIENDIRGLLRNFGLKVGLVGAVKFEERISELVEGRCELAEIVTPLLEVRCKLREQFTVLHRRRLRIVRDDEESVGA
ncbi:hypothetical protein SAMN05428953_1453 [Mesorhizobium muleiense]|uniref:Transposase n=1 Tax=Mesorhizobium muleiense TaxID=1004279 RepID=A0A1G9L0M3_9HYPH|nr:hypothetical protein SAMN05428953_1453 [Mesorhizobium muleiense]